jgi:hypothetical protein
MYHPSVPMNSDELEQEAAVAASEPEGYETGSERLREAHLQNGQIEARALFAPYFAIVAVGAALLTAWAMFGSVRLELVVGWVAVVAFANWATFRRVMDAAAWGSSRTARAGRDWVAVAEAVGGAADLGLRHRRA